MSEDCAKLMDLLRCASSGVYKATELRPSDDLYNALLPMLKKSWS
jgi:hypothetical protein